MAQKHLFQLRRKEPRAGRRDPYYSPERDIAYIGPQLLAGAMRSLDEEKWEPWLKQYMLEHDITEEKLVELQAPLKLAKAVNRIVQEEHPPAALIKEGFNELPPEIQMVLYARIGQVFLAAMWSGVKDVSKPDDSPPAAMEEILEDAETAYQGFLDGPRPE